MDASELRLVTAVNRHHFIEYLTSIREPLYTRRDLARVLRRFIDYVLKPAANRAALVNNGVLTPQSSQPAKIPMHPWLTARLVDLYPEAQDNIASTLGITAKDREDILTLKIEILEELHRIASEKKKSPDTNPPGPTDPESKETQDPWLNVMKRVLEMGKEDRICKFFEWDHQYLRRNLLRKPPEYGSLIRSGGVSDLLEVVGYFRLHFLELNRVAEMLDAAGMLKCDLRRGTIEITQDRYSQLSRERRHHFDALLGYAYFSQLAKTIDFFWTRYDLHVVMNALFENEWEAQHPFRVADRFFSEQRTAFIRENFIIQQGKNKDEWMAVYDGSPPFFVKHPGLKCIARLLQAPCSMERVYFKKLDELLGPSTRPGRVSKKASPSGSRRKNPISRVRNSIWYENGAVEAIRQKCSAFADHLELTLKDEKSTRYWYEGDKFSYLNVKFAA